MDTEKLARLFLQLSMFGLVIAVWMAGVTLFVLKRSQRNRKLQRRLEFAQQGADDERVIRLWRAGKPVDAFVPDAFRMSLMERLERMREDAGWQMSMANILAILAAATGLLTVLVWAVTDNAVLAVGFLVMVAIGFRMYLLRCINKRTALFEKQLVEALDLGARSLRAGHPLSGAFKLISQEIGAPVSTIFAEIIEQEALGVSLQRALYNVSQKSRSPDMKIFATSVVIQLRSGGNLADMIDRVAWVVRERLRLHRKARVLTAEAQLSKWVLLALPLGMFVLLNLINNEYMEPFYTTFLGKLMMIIAVIMLAIGAWIMNRMAALKY